MDIYSFCSEPWKKISLLYKHNLEIRKSFKRLKAFAFILPNDVVKGLS